MSLVPNQDRQCTNIQPGPVNGGRSRLIWQTVKRVTSGLRQAAELHPFPAGTLGSESDASDAQPLDDKRDNSRNLEYKMAFTMSDGRKNGEFFASATVNEVVACLVSGANPNARNRDGVASLHWAAAKSGHLDVIEALLAAGADLHARDNDGWTPLLWASSFGKNRHVVELLLDAGSALDARAKDGKTPLHLAARNNGSPCIVEALLGRGADPTVRDNDGWTPLHWAATFGADLWAIATLLAPIETSYENDTSQVERPLSMDGRTPNAQAIELLSNATPEPSAWTTDGYHSLHLSAGHNNDSEVMKTLLRRYASPNVSSHEGTTPLLHALEEDTNSAVIEVLLEAGADHDTPSSLVEAMKNRLLRDEAAWK